MVVFLALNFGLVVWIVLWALGIKAFDAFMITMVIVVGALAYSAVAPFLPGNRTDEHPPPGA